MKKIIKNKVYETEKAKEIGSYEPNPNINDFHWYIEKLYKKKTGEFFLYGKGNAASKYNKAVDDHTSCGTEKIIPLTYEEAMVWTEEHLDAEIYETLFGSPEEEGRTSIHIYLDNKVIFKLKTSAAKKGIALGEYITQLLEKEE